MSNRLSPKKASRPVTFYLLQTLIFCMQIYQGSISRNVGTRLLKNCSLEPKKISSSSCMASLVDSSFASGLSFLFSFCLPEIWSCTYLLQLLNKTVSICTVVQFPVTAVCPTLTSATASFIGSEKTKPTRTGWIA